MSPNFPNSLNLRENEFFEDFRFRQLRSLDQGFGFHQERVRLQGFCQSGTHTPNESSFCHYRFTPTMFRKPFDSLTTNVVATPLVASREENNVGSQERTVFFFVTLPLRIM